VEDGVSGSPRIRVVIADDEPAGRRAIQLLLSKDPVVRVVAQCGTGEDTLAAIQRHQPDLLFLDIQMPGCDGFEVLARVPAESRPVILFVTAFEEYAVRAFGVHAEDYLLKPFSDARFREAVAHAKARLRERTAAEAERVAGLLQRLGGEARRRPANFQPASTDRLAVRSSRGIALLALDDILWIEARGDYVRIHSTDRTDLLREPISAMEHQLDAGRFVRVHRSAIVNLARVRELEVSAPGVYSAVLQNGERCRLSRKGRERLERLLQSSF
jgi:two-component system, LytTR family, response regulator